MILIGTYASFSGFCVLPLISTVWLSVIPLVLMCPYAFPDSRHLFVFIKTYLKNQYNAFALFRSKLQKQKNTVLFWTLPFEYRSEFRSSSVLISGAAPGHVVVGSDRLKIEKSTTKVVCERIVVRTRRTRS